NERVKPFFAFCQELINYLDHQAKDEFINNARNELLQAIVTLQENLKPFADVSKNDNDKSEDEIEQELRIAEVVKQLDVFVENLTEQIKGFTTQICNNAKADFWNDGYTIEVEKEIDKKFSQVNKENLKTELICGTDYEILLSRLPSEIDKNIRLNFILREKLVLSIKSFFVESQNQLLFKLRDVNKDYLPSQTFDLLKDKLSRRDIEMRFNGLADFLFFNYGDKIYEIGKNFISSIENEPHETIIDGALKTYEKELKKFTKELKNDINKYVARSLKNHTEYLENELLNILIEQREFIVQQITRKINISEIATFEKNRRNTINNAYSVLTQLSNEL
ncbi:hypothetical protein LC605_15525, partial [Nostoc sp. CHAB 5836]|nr:hypothetical protein [Nostoc sp. CHAB 5836]